MRFVIFHSMSSFGWYVYQGRVTCDMHIGLVVLEIGTGLYR